MMLSNCRWWGGVAMVLVCGVHTGTVTVSAQSDARAQVVVVVDTSTSMASRFDQERESLLVTRLLSDIVQGELAVLRLVDWNNDPLLDTSGPGEPGPCAENPSRTCTIFPMIQNMRATLRGDRIGAEIRPRLGDAAFKRQLETHLTQTANHSEFSYSFVAAGGVFDQWPASAEGRRTVVWLSDANSTTRDETGLRAEVQALQADGVRVEAVVFGGGNTRLPRAMELETAEVGLNPGALMQAFAGVYRRIVQAPYELDNTLASDPTFAMRPQIDEAWVVVSGDRSLTAASLADPNGNEVDWEAKDQYQNAGAYRVFHMTDPAAGTWTVEATGGGGVAYAVVQLSNMVPHLVGPASAREGDPVQLVAEMRGRDQAPVAAGDLPPDLTLTATVDGVELVLARDPTGRFTAETIFSRSGAVPVEVHAVSEVIDRTVTETVAVDLATLRPVLVEVAGVPVNELTDVPVGEPVSVTVELRDETGAALAAADVPPDVRVLMTVAGETYELDRNGDGRFVGTVVFRDPGDASVTITKRSDAGGDEEVRTVVRVRGVFRVRRDPDGLDLGALAYTAEACRPVQVEADHRGVVPLEVVLQRPLPDGHALELRVTRPGQDSIVRRAQLEAVAADPFDFGPDDDVAVCLVTEQAESSQPIDELWLTVRAVNEPTVSFGVRLTWMVVGMTWWERYGGLVLLLVLLTAVLVVGYGFLWPYRFAPALGYVFVAEYEDLEDEFVQPLRQWRGVGRGWYRHARAYFHGNYRISGKSRGAVASLNAESRGARVKAGSSHSLSRRLPDGTWEEIGEEGRRVKSGEVYRVDDRGPFIKSATKAR